MNPTDHSTEQASVPGDPMDEVAALLMGDEAADETGDGGADATHEQTQEQTDPDELLDAEELPDDDSTDSDSDDESDESDDNDQTLQQMLGVSDDQIEVNDAGEIMINVKVDGKQSKHSLSEVIKNYQLESSTTNKSQALSEERKAFETAAAAKTQEISTTLQQNTQLAEMLEQEIMADYRSIDWNDLRQFDPAEWTAKRQEFGAKYQKVQHVKEQLAAQGQQLNEQQVQQQRGQQQAILQDQWGVMIKKNPTWSDEKVYKQDMTQLKDFAKDAYGYSDGDFGNVSDARIVEVLKDAMLYRKGSRVADKKLKKVPKVQRRGGSRKAPKVSKSERLAKAAKAAKGANKRNLQTDAVAALLTGN